MDTPKDRPASLLHFDRKHHVEAAKILPGGYFATDRNIVLVTVLGSCVCACIRDPVSKIGGMNHFMLPHHGADFSPSNPMGESARYGTYAMEILINQLLKMGANRDNLEAKVFGGAAVLSGFTVNNVGARNAEFVLQFLKTERIPVLAQDLLNVNPRKVYYFPATGVVRVKSLAQNQSYTIIRNTVYSREVDYDNRLHNSRLDGDVELFK